MKIIEPSVEFLGAVPTDYAGALRFIEAAGRTCYRSDDKITDTSAEPFVKRLIKAGHLAMVEHSNFVVRADLCYLDVDEVVLLAGKYLRAWTDNDSYVYLGGNLTAWVQRYADVSVDEEAFGPFVSVWGRLFGLAPVGRLGLGKRLFNPCPHGEIQEELHHYSARFICDRGVSHELVRHRPCSFAQTSTRYVNYGGKDMEFIEPAGFGCWETKHRLLFEADCTYAEEAYNDMLGNGFKPQQARAVLPNALKTEIVVTCDAAEWRHIRSLRQHTTAHPDMVRLMDMMPWEEFL